jgi:hypothetical protein
MRTSRFSHRCLPAALGAAALLLGHPAHARPRPRSPAPVRVCYTYRAAIRAEQDARLVEALRLLEACATAGCSPAVQRQCAAHHARIEDDLPSIVPLVTDETDAPVVDVDVTMDGAPLVSGIDGRAVAVDPGLHELTFLRKDVVIAKRKVVVAQGQRNHLVAVTLRPPEPQDRPRASLPAVVASAPPAPEEPEPIPVQRRSRVAPAARSSSVAPYLLTVVGLAGLGGYPLLTYWGRQDNDRLAACSPNCSAASVNHIRQLYLGADVSLGVGIAALLAATWIAVGSGPADKERARYSFDVHPGAAGTTLSMSGAF